MKKTFSIFLSLLLAISCLSVGSINAFANTKKTAQEIYLNSSAAVWATWEIKHMLNLLRHIPAHLNFIALIKAMAVMLWRR